MAGTQVSYHWWRHFYKASGFVFSPSSLSNDSCILIQRPVKLTAALENSPSAEEPALWSEIFLERRRFRFELSQAEEKAECGSPTFCVSTQTQGWHGGKGHFGEPDPPWESGLLFFSLKIPISDNCSSTAITREGLQNTRQISTCAELEQLRLEGSLKSSLLIAYLTCLLNLILYSCAKGSPCYGLLKKNLIIYSVLIPCLFNFCCSI